MVSPAGRKAAGRARGNIGARPTDMGPRLHGVASRTGKIESRAGKAEGWRFLRLKFRRTRYHNRSHARSSRRVAGPLGQMLRCSVTAGEVTDMAERSAARGGVD